MGLSVRVVGQPGQCVAAGGGRFILRPASSNQGNRYQLPQLELARLGDGPPVRLIALQPRPAAGDALTEAVLAAWSATGLRQQVVTAAIRTGDTAWIDTELVQQASGVTVTWLVSHATDQDPPEEFEVTVDLTFQPEPGTHPAKPAVPPHPGFVTIDFGTSNSTAVLYDQDRLITKPLAGQQAMKLRDTLITLIEAQDVPAAAAGQFAALTDRIARSVLGNRAGSGEPRERLLSALRNEPVADARREPELLYAVLLRLERELPARSQPLRSWLADRLHDCYDRTFAVPGLDGLQLFPVELDPVSGSHELPSRIEATQLSPLRVAMTVDDGQPVRPGRYHLGLKQHLGKPEQRQITTDDGSTTVDTDQLIEAALWFLVEQSNTFIEQNPGRLARGRLNHAVVTYPTIAPPAVRHRLRQWLLDPSNGLGLSQVQGAYDEAIAAVLFFLMRDFGGEFEIGVEAVKSRYRRVQNTDQAWTQNILVIDIGGGTTDIALVTMTLTDQTPPEPKSDQRWYGRYYVLTPQVRGSTGNLQLGGEYLTLRVFRWLKAEIADQLLTRAPGRYPTQLQALPQSFKQGSQYQAGSLVDAVLANCENETLLDTLDAVVPTRWHTNPANEQAFWLLWQLADRAKLAMGQPDASEFMISATELRQVLNATVTAAGQSEDQSGSLDDLSVRLTVERFNQIIEEPLVSIMRLASSLALHRLDPGDDSPEQQGRADSSGTRPPEPLDRIILTGKTSALTQVRNALNTHFGQKVGQGARVQWNSTGVTVEREYSKLATAIGACWAESIRQYAFDPDGAVRRLREGKTVLNFDVNNLFFNLPATFAIGEQENYAPRITVGTELLQLDAEPIGKARSADPWDPLTEMVSVHRVIDDNNPLLWGNFKYGEQAEASQLNPAVWPSEIRTQLEITQNLDLTVRLCRGEPHYVVSGPSIDVLAAIREFCPEEYANAKELPEYLPGDLKVDSLTAGSSTRGNTVLLRSGEQLTFGKRFFDDDKATDGVDGLECHVGLQPPAGRRADGPTGSWVFTLRVGTEEKTIGTLPRPTLSGGNFPTNYRVTLDRTGRLRVHAGALPYRTATCMLQVEQDRGRVFTTPMPPARPAMDNKRNPFNGEH